MSETTEKTAILELFNLDRNGVQNVSYSNADGSAVIDILLRPDYPSCPDCGCSSPVIKEYQLKKINHSVLSDRKCTLYYHARRYQCPVCHRTYYENNPFAFKKQKISALTVMNILKDLKDPAATFASVAKRYHVSPTTAASIFDSHVLEERRPLPELMCWDENYAFHHLGEDSKYVFVMLDFITQEPIDILPSRRKEYLRSYFLKIPLKERKKVKMIATDMYEEYRGIIHEIFPHCLHSIDHYHLSQELSRKVDRVRIRVMKSVSKYVKGTQIQTDEYYLLKKFSWLVFKRPDAKTKDKKDLFDPGAEKKMNRKLNKLLNFYDIKELMMKIHPDLRKAWDLKDKLVDFYDNNTYDTVQDSLNELIRSFASSGVEEMTEFYRTLKNWKDEIINSFIVVSQRHTVDKGTGQVVVSDVKLNNGLMENRNSIIKTIKKASNGYTNWERFRGRCLYVLRKSAAPRLNPEIPQKTTKKGGN